MSSPARPKAVLFDLGGVCVSSPFQAILDYEIRHGIPPGWVNFSISKSAPDGYWQRLETGAIPLDGNFYAGFSNDLHNPSRWQSFFELQRSKNPKLPEKIPPLPRIDAEQLFSEMMAYSSRPDPWIFPALKKLKASGKFVVAALSNTIIFPPGHQFYRKDFLDDPVRSVFDVFISSAHVGLRKPDPRIYRLALEEMDRFAKAHRVDDNRTPRPWKGGIAPREVLFLDDIGENLRAARQLGFRTIKVHLGRTVEAVEELELVTGLQLAGESDKNLVKSTTRGQRPKI